MGLSCDIILVASPNSNSLYPQTYLVLWVMLRTKSGTSLGHDTCVHCKLNPILSSWTQQGMILLCMGLSDSTHTGCPEQNVFIDVTKSLNFYVKLTCSLIPRPLPDFIS